MVTYQKHKHIYIIGNLYNLGNKISINFKLNKHYFYIYRLNDFKNN